ncbi:hypothetical protein AMECASPLE_017483 [Ameca splendens]|uniref:Uncharacterized protein n=1 Tax=Ameca splendens TaxID=208324 RepID=A0ABV0Y2N0_9TELE
MVDRCDTSAPGFPEGRRDGATLAFVNQVPSLPDPDSVSGPVLEESQDEPPSPPVLAREGFGDGLPSLPVPVLEELRSATSTSCSCSGGVRERAPSASYSCLGGTAFTS